MKTLKEIKEQFEQTNVRGDKANILAYHPGQVHPIIAEISHNNRWRPINYTEEGNNVYGNVGDLDLVPKKVGLDYSKLPEDTLIMCGDIKCYIAYAGREIPPNTVMLFGRGATSDTEKSRTLEHARDCKIIENKPVAWFGGECPIPEGVKFRVWYRNGDDDMGTTGLDWSHLVLGSKGDIIAYQILGEL